MKAHLTAWLGLWALINAHQRHKIEQQKIEFLWVEIAKKLPLAHMSTHTHMYRHNGGAMPASGHKSEMSFSQVWIGIFIIGY